jgi:hypothetical protein
MDNKIIKRIKSVMPENPYPEIIFPMTTKDYAKAIPDPMTRTAISGCIGRWAFDMTKKYILDKLIEEFENESDEQK